MRLRLNCAAMVLIAALGVPVFAALPPGGGGDAQPMPSLAPMVKRVSPAVVSIATRGTVREQMPRNPLLEDPFFRRFFDVPPDYRERQREFQSAGSGVIVDAKNGYIITNHHVVENASEITVTMADDRTFKAKVIGSDEGADIAVLQAKQPNLTALTLGDSSKIEVGDYVVAIGNPFGLQHTVTAGIISALGRTGINPEGGGYEDFIQTDASINPGNSGGALVNLRGELVGINAAILSRSGGNIGIGFAIPVNLVKNAMEQLIKYGEVRRGVLGVQTRPIGPDLARRLHINESSGALISNIAANSAAEHAGLRAGDIITSLNGISVHNPGEVRNAIGLLPVGEKVEIGLLRDGNALKVSTTVTERAAVDFQASEIHRSLEGAQLLDSPDETGVLVKSIREGSPAADTGLRPNDVIFGVGRNYVVNLKALREAAKGASVLVLKIRRNGDTFLVPLQ